MNSHAASGPAGILMNVRVLAAKMTGVQRYARELERQFSGAVERIAPPGNRQGWSGHLWEQTILPASCRRRLLFSPGNTGPMAYHRQVVTVHDAATLDHPEWFEGRFSRWYRFLLPRLLRSAARVITVSEFSRQRLLASGSIDEKRLVAIPNGVDERFRPATEEGVADLRERLALQRPYFLYVGSLEPRKNLARLLKAWELANTDGLELVLGGSAGHAFRDRGFDELPPNARLLGRIPDEDLPTLYSGAVALAFPSIYEGFGLPPIEAMACGCPVLVSNTTSLPETCGPEYSPEPVGEGAVLYFDPEDLESIAGALQRMISLDPADRRAMVANGIRRAERFSWNRTAEQTWKVLEAAAG